MQPEVVKRPRDEEGGHADEDTRVQPQRRAFRVGLVSGVRHADVLPVNAGRAALVDGLIESLDLAGLERIPAAPCAWSNLELFHEPAYLAALQREAPDERFGLAFDGHPFAGLAEHCKSVAGATLCAVQWLLRATRDEKAAAVALNWHGGRHHARAAEASGWCFVNDAALAMLLLRRGGLSRLAYFDMDVHAGDAVEEACDEDVLYVSMHLREPGFFPFPGGGPSEAAHVLNLPLRRGLSDETFLALFHERVAPRLAAHAPQALLLQLGADGLAGDPVGLHWNLTPRAHCAVVAAAKQLCPRVLVLGGGGYHHPNTARCWAAATHAALDAAAPLPAQVPDSCPGFPSFGPDFDMHVRPLAHIADENKL